MNLTTQERVELQRRTALAMHRLNESENVRDALADIYCEYLPGKDRWQGEMMADKLISSVTSLRDQFAEANESMDGYISRRLEETVRGMDTETACRSLYALSESLRALDSGVMAAYFSNSEPERALEELRNTVAEREYPGPFDLAARNRLIQETRELLSKSTLTTWAIDEIKQIAGQDAPRRVIEGRIREDTLTAVNAMVLYTMAAGGSISSFDYPVTMDEVVLAVCTREYIEQAYRDYRSGIVSLRSYEKLASALSAVAILTLWTLESAGTLALVILSAENAGFITAILTAVLMMNALGDLNELLEEDIERIFSKLSMDLYRKALTKHIRRETKTRSAAVLGETAAAREALPAEHTDRRIPQEIDYGALCEEIEDDMDIVF